MSNRNEGRKWRENTNQKAPDGFSRLEVFEKAATKKDNHNHPNSIEDYRIENIKISGNMVKAQVQSGATAQEAMQPSRAETV